MDKLKDFIDTNRARFEQEEEELLPFEHEARFLRKLEPTAQAEEVALPTHRRQRFVALSFAATLAACMALLLWMRLPGSSAEAADDPFLAEVRLKQTEMNELQAYYQMQIRDVCEQIKDVCEQEPTPAHQAIRQESELVWAGCQQFEQNELPHLPAEEPTLVAMTQQYGNSLETLRFMLNHMEQTKDNK